MDPEWSAAAGGEYTSQFGQNGSHLRLSVPPRAREIGLGAVFAWISWYISPHPLLLGPRNPWIAGYATGGNRGIDAPLLNSAHTNYCSLYYCAIACRERYCYNICLSVCLSAQCRYCIEMILSLLVVKRVNHLVGPASVDLLSDDSSGWCEIIGLIYSDNRVTCAEQNGITT